MDKVQIPDHEEVFGEPRSEEVAERTRTCKLRTDHEVQSEAYRKFKELQESSQTKLTYTFQEQRYAVFQVKTIGAKDSSNKTTPSEPHHPKRELGDYFSVPGYNPNNPEANPNNVMLSTLEDMQTFAEHENDYTSGNTYFVATSNLKQESGARWDNGEQATNIYPELIIPEREFNKITIDSKTSKLSSFDMEQKEESTTELSIDLSALDGTEEEHVSDDVDTSSIQAVSDWANANHTTPEVVKLLEAELGMELDKNADDTLSKKGLCTVYATIVRNNRNNVE